MLCLLAAAVFLAAAPALLADTITVGTPGANPGDWVQGWQETGVPGGVTSIEAFLETAGVSFAGTGLSNFNDGSWTPALNSPQSASAAGNVNTDLLFDTSFTTGSGTPFTMDLYSFTNGALNNDATSARWNGSGWSYGAPIGLANEVPEPPAIYLMLGGLLLLGFAFRKRLGVFGPQPLL